MIVGVHPLAGFDKLLHYRVPEHMRADLTVGALVRVPIVNRLHLGLVGEIAAPKDFPVDKLKSVVQLIYNFPALTATCSNSRAGCPLTMPARSMP